MNKEEEIKELEQWLANRPSPSMDPCIEERWRKSSRLAELKQRPPKERLPTKMMEAQTINEPTD